MNDRQLKILGGLLGASVGDSMGTVTEMFSSAYIYQRFGGWVTELLTPTEDGLAINARAGMVSDDFSVGYYTAEVLLEAGSKITTELAVEGLLRWWEHPEYTCYSGPSTRNGVERLLGKKVSSPTDFLKCNNALITDGGGMKAGMMGLFNPGDLDAAIDDAIIMCSLTHNNTIALSAACAVAAATAQAMVEDTSYIEVINAGIYGAEESIIRTKGQTREVAGCDIKKRIDLAVQIGLQNQGDRVSAMTEIADVVGCGLFAYESIPAAFGMFVAAKGDVMDSLFMAVNAGDDTDTVACIVGYFSGAFSGAGSIPKKFWEPIDRENKFNLKKMAVGIDQIVEASKES